MMAATEQEGERELVAQGEREREGEGASFLAHLTAARQCFVVWRVAPMDTSS